ncbi:MULTISPECIES: molybdenum ABC transporter ATP-binding protein [unclassified Ectothiorhodospira]|uniref:molybdenum ABC transporter ATP-binding protein n=1 Tax=unclassified Ectothiorhodospira TaxID=2684909 RepID=UPI001EE88DC8|nr:MULTISPECIES: molybdenum ABC transporter ATP-binding protein [unclassified Ectothiorhodospira]MCG5516547.1 molybdenum ABC transporter ATP-binding protein [Ectothiorhodospira sp. 9100]MCG5518360.1 molybdenum ABC transporter ATP-binding protein [Ectothiorhodospira sp. 9905]
MSIQARFHLQRGAFSLDVDLHIPGRGVTALFGRSGSGKTTILRCLAGLERIQEAHLQFNGDLWQGGEHFMPVHQRPLGYVFQEASLFPHLSVRHNLLYGFKRIAAEERRVQLDDVVSLLGLESLLSRFPDALSGGQRQRVAIGRALLTSPRLLLMDEPMVSLDETSKGEILPYLERLRDELSIPVVYVSHAIEEVARLADHMVLLENGRVLAQGPLQALLTRTDLPLAHSEQASAVIEGTVAAHHEPDHLTEMAFPGGTLLISHQDRAIGTPLRVRILARDVSVALERPKSSSVLNSIPAKITQISEDPHPGHVILNLAAGEHHLLARISACSCRQLDLSPGQSIWAMVKGIAVA